jgi:hypothetical protein
MVAGTRYRDLRCRITWVSWGGKAETELMVSITMAGFSQEGQLGLIRSGAPNQE